MATEVCDDGVNSGAGGCDIGCDAPVLGWSCTAGSTTSPSVCHEICGDGIVTISQACDDNNLISGDGCSGICIEEPGFDCTGAPSVCLEVCGDSMRVGLEACDDGGLSNST